MRRSIVVLFGLAVLCCAGCGSDEREPIIQEMIRQVDIAGTKVKGIRGKVDEAVSQANKKAEKEKRSAKPSDLPESALTPALESVKGLKEISAGYLQESQKAQRIKEPITTEQQEKYAKEFGSKVQSEMAELEREQEKLYNALGAAEKINPDSTKKLREKLQEAFGEFESIAKRS